MVIANENDSSASSADASPARRVRMCIIVTIDLTILNLCRGRLEYLTERGFDITVVCGPTTRAAEIEARGVRLHAAPLTRMIAPWRDLRAIWNLYRFLRRERFDLIEVSTPKGALVGSIAAWLAGGARVVHLLRGLAYQGQRGWRARLLRRCHAIPCRLADRVISISKRTMDQACADRVCRPEKIEVLGHGSSNGVDMRRFAPALPEARGAVRCELGLPEDAVVAGFMGRLTGDKGIVELVDAFGGLSEAVPSLHLLIVGDYEDRDRPPQRVIDAIAENPRIVHVGWQQDTPRYYGAMDLLVLPTHREGFGTVLLEAGAMALPVISTKAAGWWAAVEKDREAVCVPIGDTAGLRAAMMKLAESAELRQSMGAAVRKKVRECYDCQTVWSRQEHALRRLLAERAS